MESDALVAGSRRQEILDATAAVFARRGYHGTGMRDIADRLGMQAGSLYFHLSSKAEALEEVCARGLECSYRSAEAALQSGDDLATRLAALIAANLAELKAHGDYIAVYLHERQHLSEAARTRMVGLSRRYRDLLDDMFASAEARGEVRPGLDRRFASLITVGTLRNLSQLHVEGPLRDLEAFADAAVDALRHGIVKG